MVDVDPYYDAVVQLSMLIEYVLEVKYTGYEEDLDNLYKFAESLSDGTYFDKISLPLHSMIQDFERDIVCKACIFYGLPTIIRYRRG